MDSDSDIRDCMYDREGEFNDCTHDDDVTMRCVPPTWAGMYIHVHVYLLHGLVCTYINMCTSYMGWYVHTYTRVPPTWAGMYIHVHVYLLYELVCYLVLCDEVLGNVCVVSKL